MGSDNTSKVEVKNPKSRKRTKKKDKSEDLNNKRNCNTDVLQDDVNEIKEINEQNMISKKRKQRKQESNNSRNLNGMHNETIKNDEQENNFNDTQKDQDKKESSNEITSTNKFQKTYIMSTDNNLEDAEVAHKSNSRKPKQPSKRQLKREKAEKKENEKKEASRLEAMKKGLSYVSKWKHAQSEWKFEKLRQIWLIDNLLDENSISDDIFPTVLEYFEGCKGMAREQLLKKGLDVIKKVEENEEKDKMESVAYQRARKLLQALPTET